MVLDFSRSFVTFVTHGRGNNARIQVECRCELSPPGGEAVEFLLVASCKSEHTYAPDDLFMQPNYDFCCLFSPTDYQIVRTHSTADRGGKETGVSTERFEAVRIDVRTIEAEPCPDRAAIVAATLANRPLVGRTELADDASGWRARLEYPIKTMNANDIETIFQVDTGPVVYPDFGAATDRLIDGFELAYLAYNDFSRAEFILQRPTSLPEDESPVDRLKPVLRAAHYSAVRKLPARNSLWAI